VTETPSETTIPVPTSNEEADELLRLIDEDAAVIADAKLVAEAEIADAKFLFESVAGPRQELNELRRQALIKFYERRRRSLGRRFGRIVALEHGKFGARIVPKSLVTPSDTKPLVAKLLHRAGGKRYLTVSYTLNRRALAQANPKLLKWLGLGTYASAHEHLFVQANSESEPITVKKRRYPRVSRRTSG
jgi:hypothetical protein